MFSFTFLTHLEEFNIISPRYNLYSFAPYSIVSNLLYETRDLKKEILQIILVMVDFHFGGFYLSLFTFLLVQYIWWLQSHDSHGLYFSLEFVLRFLVKIKRLKFLILVQN